jgi:5-methylcytosine-specific restriction endonuclease McrA
MSLIDCYSAVQSFLALFSASLRYQEQRLLFCPCGQNFPAIRGLCRTCYRAAAHSRHYFSGLRGEILERDGHQCRACGSAVRLHVHHRKPGVNDRDWLITVCAGCHARLHRLAALRVWIPELLVALWIEQHPDTPVQLQLPVAA